MYTKRGCHSRHPLFVCYTDKQLKNIIGIKLSHFFLRRFRPFPCPVTVVNDKHHRRDRPGDRVAEDDGVESRGDWFDEEEPGDTQQADTEAGDKHRDHNISGSAECTGELFDENEQAVCRSDVVQHLHTDGDYIFIGGEQTEQRGAEVVEDKCQCEGGAKPHTKSDADTLFHTVVFSGTEILAYESRYGDTERVVDHPVEGIDLSERAPGSYGIGSQIV